jgi:dienelactone hydrolase
VLAHLRSRLIALLLVVCPLPAQTLPGTTPLALEGDPAARMLDGMHRFLDLRTLSAPERRASRWKRDFSTRQAYERSVSGNRERLRKISGAADERLAYESPVAEVPLGQPPQLASGPGYTIRAVRWPVLNGVDGVGLLLEPHGPPVARVVALPDADATPEMLAGLTSGVATSAQFARRLAENGCLVLVPVLIDRGNAWSGNTFYKRETNMPHREFIYRMSYEVGRHIIGYEVQKTLAAVDWFARSEPRRPVGVAGYGEGGLIALFSAALDTRINGALVSGYFEPRERLWSQPIYRNIWSILEEFGDAEIAGLVAPRALVIEASRFPSIRAFEPGDAARKQTSPGKLVTPAIGDVQSEVARAHGVFEKLGIPQNIELVRTSEDQGLPGSDASLSAFLARLTRRSDQKLQPPFSAPKATGALPDTGARMHGQVDQLVRYSQTLLLRSAQTRAAFWSKADRSSQKTWNDTTDWYRRYYWDEVTGRFPEPAEPLAAQSRQIYDEPKWTGYEIMLPVWPDVFAYGILLLPKDLKPGERRPTVVCQHGLEGRPADVIKSPSKEAEYYYARYAARLADRGFVVYAPQNPYLLGDRFRQLQRKAYPLKGSMYSFIVGQHQRLLDWLQSQPFVDPERIGLYGLSYGGVTAVRLPPLLKRYVLSICSANFNEWTWINSLYDSSNSSYLYDGQFEMAEFDFANTFNYSELASLISPRPFMVERGHNDTVAPDEWVAYEYAKVQRHYAFLGIADRTAIEYFMGEHSIRGEGTFRFLHRFLNWPEPRH